MPHNSSRIPHSLRTVIFLLRLAIGLDFFYFGFAVLFDPALGRDVGGRSFSDFYYWLSSGQAAGWIHPFAQWAFLVIGACLILGIAVRFASVIGAAIVLLSFLPGVNYASLDLAQFVNGEVILILVLVILFLANAGRYLGFDSFIHISFHKKPKPE